MNEGVKFCCQGIRVLRGDYYEQNKICPPIGFTAWSGYDFADRQVWFCPLCGEVLCKRSSPPRQPENFDFCCRGMETTVNRSDPHFEFEIFYQPPIRRYFFSTTTDCREEGVFYQEWDFNYCIYCGKKLPTSLLDQWIKIVQEQTGITPQINTQELLDQTLEKLPEELKTDAWWKKRGL